MEPSFLQIDDVMWPTTHLIRATPSIQKLQSEPIRSVPFAVFDYEIFLFC